MGGAARTGVDHAAVGLMRRTRGQDIGAGAEAGVGASGGPEAPECVGVELRASALAVGSRGAAVVESTFVPIEAEPAEVVFDGSGVFDAGALRVKVFDAQNPEAARAANGKPRYKGREDVAKMHAS